MPDPGDLMRDIGQRIRAFRKLRHVTQEDLAEAVGVSRASVVNIEGGKQGVQVDTLAVIAEHLGCQFRDLIGGSSVRPASMIGRFRVGRSLGRTIYRQIGSSPSKDDPFLGIMDTPELARMVVDALNAEGER